MFLRQSLLLLRLLRLLRLLLLLDLKCMQQDCSLGLR